MTDNRPSKAPHVGRRHVMRDGFVTAPIEFDIGHRQPFSDGKFRWASNGRYIGDSCPHRWDIIEEYSDHPWDAIAKAELEPPNSAFDTLNAENIRLRTQVESLLLSQASQSKTIDEMAKALATQPIKQAVDWEYFVSALGLEWSRAFKSEAEARASAEDFVKSHPDKPEVKLYRRTLIGVCRRSVLTQWSDKETSNG